MSENVQVTDEYVQAYLRAFGDLVAKGATRAEARKAAAEAAWEATKEKEVDA